MASGAYHVRCVADNHACFIAGTSCTAGTVNPANACQVCTPSNSTSAWSNALDGTDCDDSNACTRTDTCQAGACVGSNPVTCAATYTASLGQCAAAETECVAVCDGSCSDGVKDHDEKGVDCGGSCPTACAP